MHSKYLNKYGKLVGGTIVEVHSYGLNNANRILKDWVTKGILDENVRVMGIFTLRTKRFRIISVGIFC